MMGKDGTKLSKRHGGVAVFEYKNEGFLPEALSNYLLLLGWSPGDNREIITLQEAQRTFNVEDLGNVQARFDIDKLRWLNAEYVKNKDTKTLAELLKKSGKVQGSVEETYLERVIDLYKMRFRTLSEFVDLTACFFTDDFAADAGAQKKRDKYLKESETRRAFSEFKTALQSLDEFTKESIENICRNLAEQYNIKPASIIHPTRVAISGKTGGAGLFEMMELLGKERVVRRLDKTLRSLSG